MLAALVELTLNGFVFESTRSTVSRNDYFAAGTSVRFFHEYAIPCTSCAFRIGALRRSEYGRLQRRCGNAGNLARVLGGCVYTQRYTSADDVEERVCDCVGYAGYAIFSALDTIDATTRSARRHVLTNAVH